MSGYRMEMKNIFKRMKYAMFILLGIITVAEKINLWRGKIFSNNSELGRERDTADLREKIRNIDVPVYFFSGKYDYTVNYEMAEEYLNSIEAPEKNFYLFENSAHSPMFEEPERVKEIIEKDIIEK